MSIQITSWLRAFFALQERAMDSRGFAEIVVNEDEVYRWPRTLGRDVIAIAAVFDPSLRGQPLRFGGHGLARRWRVVVDDLERHALADPLAEYVENQTFWHALAAACVYLHSQRAPLPPIEIWNALLAQLDESLAPRNIGPKDHGPFKRFDGVKTFDDLFNAQHKHLRELRGFDKLRPDDGKPGPEKLIPRTTNADVIALTDYWAKQFRAARKVFGHDGVANQWNPAAADVEQLARKADPNALYPKNNAFWRALQQTAVQVAIADEAPTKTDLAIAALKESVTRLPENVASGAKAVASGAADVVGSLAHGAGKIANEAGRGLFSGFGTPLLVGAGLVGLFLISRAGRSEKVAA